MAVMKANMLGISYPLPKESDSAHLNANCGGKILFFREQNQKEKHGKKTGSCTRGTIPHIYSKSVQWLRFYEYPSVFKGEVTRWERAILRRD